MHAKVAETCLQCGDQRLALKIHGSEDSTPLLAFHGWRDNAASFDRLAPLLAGHRAIAPDFQGHGLSSHLHPSGNYEIWRYMDDILWLFEGLAVGSPVNILGHSMGGAVACLFAAVFPECVNKLVLLDCFGPLSTAPADAPGQMRRSIEGYQGLPLMKRRYYSSREKAVQARARVGLSMEAADLLANRSLSNDAQGWYWHTDPRLKLPNRLSLSETHIEQFLRCIACPVLIVSSPQYWEALKQDPSHRLVWFRDLRHEKLPGHHHQHLDGQVEEVAALVRQFLN